MPERSFAIIIGFVAVTIVGATLSAAAQGGGIGRVFKFAGQAFNATAEAYYNVVRAGPGSISTPGDWQFRFEVALLFPE